MRSATIFLACALAATLQTAPRAAGSLAAGADTSPLTVVSARVSLDGTSNVHPFTASTTMVRVLALELGPRAGELLDSVLKPGGLTAFEVAIPAATLTSPRDGVDKNMHKALKVLEHPDIRFRLRALQSAAGAYQATGWLTVAGVEKEVTLALQVVRTQATLAVTGTTDVLMTDFGIAPPKALMGMVKADPKVKLRIEMVLGAPLT